MDIGNKALKNKIQTYILKGHYLAVKKILTCRNLIHFLSTSSSGVRVLVKCTRVCI